MTTSASETKKRIPAWLTFPSDETLRELPVFMWFAQGVRSARALAVFIGVVALSLLAYAVNGITGEVHPASRWGITYGILSVLALAAVMAYAARRRMLAVRPLGRSRIYLLVHLYGGVIFLLLMVMHTGFTPPRGPMTVALWVLSLWVVVTGVMGVLLQKWLAVMLDQLGVEVQLGRIPTFVDDLRGRAEAVVASAGRTVQDLYESALAAGLAGPQFRWSSFAGIVDDKARRIDFVNELLPTQNREELAEVRRLVRTKAEIDVHYTLQRTLRTWLWVHIPPAVALLALVVAHVVLVLYY